MMGRTPNHIKAIRPLKDGVIADFEVCEKMLRYFIQKVHASKWSKPRMVICVPSGITGVEQRAVQDAAEYAGARKPVHIIEEPMAAAIGADLPVHEPTRQHDRRHRRRHHRGRGDLARRHRHRQSVRVAGDELDDAILQYVKKEFSLAIGDRTAEEIKIQMGSAWPMEDELTADIRGRDLVVRPAAHDPAHHRARPRGARRAGRRHRRRREDDARQDAARAGCRHHGGRHHCSPVVARCSAASTSGSPTRRACRSASPTSRCTAS